MLMTTTTGLSNDVDNDIHININENIIESAISILEMLSQENQRKVLDFSVGLLDSDAGNPFRAKSEEELFERIDRSLAQIESGESRDADDVIADLMEELESEEA